MPSIPLRAILISACFAASASAAVNLTVGGGLNSSSTDGDASSVNYSNRLGFNFGGGLEFEATPRFAYVVELNLETRGEVAEQPGTPFGDLKSELNLTYLEIPVLAMVKIPAGKLTFDLFAGPALGILLSAKQTTVFGGNETTSDVKENIDTFDFGIEMGAGLEAPVRGVTVFIRPSYYLGFTDIDKSGSGEDENVSLRSAKFKVGVKVPL